LPTPALAIVSQAAAAPVLAPFDVPVPIVPEPEPAAAELPPSFAASPIDAAAAFEDEVLETQLHAAVAAAADDRAVAATIDLLAAFAPPPVADDPGFPGAHPWPPSAGMASDRLSAAVSGADFGSELAEIESDIAFVRWVPTTPLPWPKSPQREGAEFVIAPETHPQPLRAAAQAVANSAAEAPAPAEWSRPRDRWSSAELPAAPSPETAITGLAVAEAASPLMSPALLEPVEPTMLDRLASLEAELSALAANDQPRAHIPAAQTVNGAGQAVMRSELATPAPLQQVPQYRPPAGLPAQQSSPPAARLTVWPELPQLDPGPAGRSSLTGGEADVMIVPRGGEQLEISSVARGPSIGTLEQRIRRARPAPEVDVETYAGYHAAVSEASVEIVRRDTHTRAVVFSDNGDAADDSGSRGHESAVRKFFKALKGDAN
jgi:hypothetical protein